MKMKDTLHANGTLGAENYLMEIKTTKHTVMVDEPESIGGLINIQTLLNMYYLL